MSDLVFMPSPPPGPLVFMVMGAEPDDPTPQPPEHPPPDLDVALEDIYKLVITTSNTRIDAGDTKRFVMRVGQTDEGSFGLEHLRFTVREYGSDPVTYSLNPNGSERPLKPYGDTYVIEHTFSVPGPVHFTAAIVDAEGRGETTRKEDIVY